MSHWAEINGSKTVIRVTVGNNNDPNEGYDWLIENLGGTWIQTSYNGNFRKNYAGIGYKYDSKLDAFISPKPYKSWLLDKELCKWHAPIPYPADGLMYSWNEEIIDWEATSFEAVT